MRRLIVAPAIVAAALSGAAKAQVIELNSSASDCYKHALEMRSDQSALNDCNAALKPPPIRTGTRIRPSASPLNAGESAVEMATPTGLRLNVAASLVNRGIVKFHAGDDAGALKDFQAASEAYPTLSEPYVNAVLVHIRREDWASAIEALDIAMELDADNPARLHYRRGWAYEAIGDWDQALEDYGRAVALAPNWELPQAELSRLSRKSRTEGS